MNSGQSTSLDPSGLHVVIPAGGAGTRLWPLSRRSHPKFLLDVVGEGVSLLEATILRLAPLAESITIVTGRAHKDAVCAQITRLREGDFLRDDVPIIVVTEPSGRNSMPAIGLAAALIARRYGAGAVVGSFAADHVIREEEAFLRVVSDAVGAARKGYVTTIGIEPRSPATGFGYIDPSEDEVAPGACAVVKFVEKPDAVTAQRYVAQGFLWNAGMFVMRAGVLLGHLQRLSPDMYANLIILAEAWGHLSSCEDEGESPSRENAAVIERVWEDLPAIAIDHAIAEPVAQEGGVAVVAARNIGWSDVGDFDALGTMAPTEGSPRIVAIDSPGSVVRSPEEKVVTIVGIPNAVVIDSGDALLVTTRAHAQRVTAVVEKLAQEGHESLL